MRRPLAALGVLLCMACAAPRKAVTAAERPVIRAVTEEIGDRRVSFVVAGVWVPLPKDKTDVIVLQHAEDRGSAIGIYFQKADPGSTVEEVTARWAMIMLSGPMLYAVTEATPPVFASDEDASFTFSGFDKKTPMASKCRIKLVSGHVAAYWAVIFSVTPKALADQASGEVDRIAESLRLEPIKPP